SVLCRHLNVHNLAVEFYFSAHAFTEFSCSFDPATEELVPSPTTNAEPSPHGPPSPENEPSQPTCIRCVDTNKPVVIGPYADVETVISSGAIDIAILEPSAEMIPRRASISTPLHT